MLPRENLNFLNIRNTGFWHSGSRVQRKSVLQPSIQASCSQYVLAHKSFQLASKLFLISRIDCNPSVIGISPKNSTCSSGNLRTKITTSIAKSTGPGLLDMTFFARWVNWTSTGATSPSSHWIHVGVSGQVCMLIIIPGTKLHVSI